MFTCTDAPYLFITLTVKYLDEVNFKFDIVPFPLFNNTPSIE